MSDDLPVFGMPTTIARVAPAPSSSAASAAATRFTEPCSLPFTASAVRPRRRYHASHSRVACGSARSSRPKMTSRGLCAASRSSAGLDELRGTRASSTSMTTSTIRKRSPSLRMAVAMCPGYH